MADEGISTSKKVVAGAALGVAIPAAVTVAKKLIGEGESKSGQTGGRSASSMRPGSSGGRSTTAKAKSATTRRTTRSAPKAGSTTAKRSSTRRSSASTTSGGANRGRTREQLYREAKRLDIEGRSSMTKAQLERSIAAHSRS